MLTGAKRPGSGVPSQKARDSRCCPGRSLALQNGSISQNGVKMKEFAEPRGCGVRIVGPTLEQGRPDFGGGKTALTGSERFQKGPDIICRRARLGTKRGRLAPISI